jgi:phosphatidylserine decarboxylase
MPDNVRRSLDALNFLLTNRIPRRAVTRFMGWFSQLEQPWLSVPSLALWRRIADLELHDAQKTHFSSIHDCFVRELKPGVRPIDRDPARVVSPCDGLIGMAGRVQDSALFQAKGFPYTLQELLIDPALVERYRAARYVTLRLTASMYHRLHAPHDCKIEHVSYISGDTWNTNPIALQRVERLFCKNERAVVQVRLTADDQRLLLVPVASILVASIRLHCLPVPLDLTHRGANEFACDALYEKGEELGFFEHGSTVLLFAPAGFELCDHLQPGMRIRVGEPLLRIP